MEFNPYLFFCTKADTKWYSDWSSNIVEENVKGFCQVTQPVFGQVV